MTRRLAILFTLVVAAFAVAGPRAQARDPIVILISFDGWRWDYIDRAPVPNLRALAARGIRAKALIPSFPSLTFPNHYTIVTGLYPGHHGIVANTMWTPALGWFSLSSAAVRDARWWGGEPIWVTAIRQGQRATTVFWPGGEAPVGGLRPTQWWPFDGTVTNGARVERVLTALALPEDQRPSLVALYFDEVDHIGHVKGPDSPDILEAARHLDTAIGQLLAGVRRLGLEDRTNVVIVADHGMTQHTDDMRLMLDDAIDPKSANVIDTGELLQVGPLPEQVGDTAAVERLYLALRGKLPHLAIYKADETPERYHYRGHAHVAPIIGVPDEGWLVTTREQEAKRSPTADSPRGAHGYDPALRAMHGLFVAAGPAVREGLLVEPFENVHIYDLLCALLQLTPSKNDGDANVTRPFLKPALNARRADR